MRAMITGASDGIGRRVAEACARAGHAVTLVARRSDRLRAVASAMPGPGHLVLPADLCRAEGLHAVCSALAATPHDLLVNCAGAGAFGAFDEVPLERHRELIDLNVSALVALSHAFLAHARRGDALVNVSSIIAFSPLPTLPVYSATKAFVTTFSEALWAHYRARGVYVCAVHPGATTSAFFASAGGTEEQRPPGWMVQHAEDVAAAILRAVERRRGPSVIIGKRNGALALLPRFFTRRFVARVTDLLARRAHRSPAAPAGE